MERGKNIALNACNLESCNNIMYLRKRKFRYALHYSLANIFKKVNLRCVYFNFFGLPHVICYTRGQNL
jgi:hypothetical protein